MDIICEFVCKISIILHCYMTHYRHIETYKFDGVHLNIRPNIYYVERICSISFHNIYLNSWYGRIKRKVGTLNCLKYCLYTLLSLSFRTWHGKGRELVCYYPIENICKLHCTHPSSYIQKPTCPSCNDIILFLHLFVCLWTNKMNYLTKDGSQKSIMLLSGDVTKYWHILTINLKMP
jgi:hypothetical protein